jgi:molybdate transport system permease protein
MASSLLHPAELEALVLSLKVAGVAMLVSLPLAILVAQLMARREFRGKAFIDGLIHAPLVLPPVVVGYLLLVTFAPSGAVGGWLLETFGISLAFDWKGAALAAAVMAFPLVVRAIRLSIEAIDPRLELAARTLGAGPGRTFLTITLPLALPGLLTGSLLGFARALGEFGATVTFVSNIPGVTQTLPLALYSAAERPGGEASALRLMLLSLAIAILALIFSEWSARRLKRRMEHSP